jgi:hypothetical protein
MPAYVVVLLDWSKRSCPEHSRNTLLPLKKGAKISEKKNWPKLLLKKLPAINKQPQDGGRRELISSN